MLHGLASEQKDKEKLSIICLDLFYGEKEWYFEVACP
jgi:hypothetical protein